MSYLGNLFSQAPTPASAPMTPQQMYGGGGQAADMTTQQMYGGGGTSMTPQQMYGGTSISAPSALSGSTTVGSLTPPALPKSPLSGSLTTTTNATEVPPFNQSFNDMVNGWVQPNPLNPYFQSTYHFRLFMTADGDQVGNLTTFADFLTQIASVEQVTIAESGVTGYTIKDVEFETILAQTATTRDTKATLWTMTIVEPMGASFLDALYYASKKLGVKNYNKMVYYLQLSFKGYDEQGGFVGNPLGFLNGGQWIYSLNLTNVETKLNEGGAVYTLQLVTVDTGSALLESDKIAANQILAVSGATLKALFDSYANVLTKYWQDQYGVDNKQTVKFAINASHAVSLGPGKGKIIEQFSLKAPTDKSYIRAFNLNDVGPDALPTGQVPKGTSINDFITGAIKSTQDGQALIKSVTQQGQIDDPARPIRESTLFTIETDVQYTGEYNETTGSYTKLITLHVIPFYTQALLLSAVQRDNAQKSADVQRTMVQNLGVYGLVKKRYDYIFTGENTEVLDYNIHFNMAFQAILPKFGGGRLNFPAMAVPSRYTASTDITQAPFPVDPNAPTQIDPDAAAWGAAVPAVIQAPLPLVTNSMTSTADQAAFAKANTSAVGQNQTKLIKAMGGAAQTAPSTTPAAAVPVTSKGTNTYIEDLMNQVNQGQPIDTIWRPISFQTGDANIEREAGVGFPGQWGLGGVDRSFMGTAFAQMYSSPVTGDLQTIDLTIRGDPYWLGQCNTQRQIVLRNNQPVYNPADIPDWSSNQPGIFVYFRYPTQVGDDFKPVLNDANVFNGLYNVTNVKHTFGDGVYKQVLHAVVMPLINLAAAFSTGANSISYNSDATSSPLGTQARTTPTSGVTPGSGGSTIAPSGSLPNASQQALAQDSYNFWIAQGYPPGAAAGMVAQEQAESHFGTDPNTNANPDAQGNFQWSPARAAAIQAATGINVSTADHQQQLQAAAWELSPQGPEHAAGTALQAVGDDGGLGGQTASLRYERPANGAVQAQARGGSGALWAQTFNHGIPPA